MFGCCNRAPIDLFGDANYMPRPSTAMHWNIFRRMPTCVTLTILYVLCFDASEQKLSTKTHIVRLSLSLMNYYNLCLICAHFTLNQNKSKTNREPKNCPANTDTKIGTNRVRLDDSEYTEHTHTHNGDLRQFIIITWHWIRKCLP